MDIVLKTNNTDKVLVIANSFIKNANYYTSEDVQILEEIISKTDKKEVLEKYKFAICYENARDIDGYITEKIFDCFFAGCIPIYWGANNVTEHIPKECFIDKREFESYEDLYEYINYMSNEEYLKYINAIENYLNSSKANEFRAEYFANTIVETILNDIK